jgi:OmpA-OmpF porin, OOP family
VKYRILLAALGAMLAAGCTTYTGPTQTTRLVKVANGTQAYQVECHGLFESSNACFAQVRNICKDKQPHLVSQIDDIDGSFNAKNNPRQLTFTCDTPAAAQPAPQPAAPQPVPQPAVPRPVVVPSQKILLQGDANFNVGSATLTPAATTKLDKFAGSYQGVNIKRLSISGYTDSTGSAVLNDRLSEARARSVQSYLTSRGVRASSYDVRGYGAASPVAPNNTAAGRAMNRRVEIDADGN